jgi:hypothetical protein
LAVTGNLLQFQIKDAIKAARIKATKAYKQYAEEPKTSQRRGGFDLELVLTINRDVPTKRFLNPAGTDNGNDRAAEHN